MSSDDIKKWRANWAAHEATMGEDQKDEKSAGQEIAKACPAVFAKWRVNPKEEKKKRAMLATAFKVNRGLEGGIPAFMKSLKKAMNNYSKDGFTPYKGAHGSKPEPMLQIDETDPNRQIELETKGLGLVGTSAFVLLAGGSGHRLKLKGAKLAQIADTSRNITLLEHFLAHIMAFQTAARAQAAQRDKNSIQLPVVILTNDDNNDEVRELLEANNYFGFADGQITLIAQGRVFAVKDSDHVFAVGQKDPFAWELRNPGAGAVHHLLAKEPGLLDGWSKRGVRYITFFPDNNLLGLHNVLKAFGVTAECDLEVNYLAIPRPIPDPKHGDPIYQPIVKFHKKKPEPHDWLAVIPNDLVSTVFEVNKLKDSGAGGYSDYPAATGTFIVNLESYISKVANPDEELKLMEYVKPEWKDQKKQSFKNALGESLQCIPESIGEHFTTTGYTLCPPWQCSSLLIQSWDEGKLADKNKMSLHTLATAEAGLYYYHRRMLSEIGGKVELDTKDFNAGGLPMAGGARIIMEPSFAVSIPELIEKFQVPRGVSLEPESKIGVSVSNKSVLILGGNFVRVAGLQVDGALKVTAGPNSHVLIDNLNVVNNGWTMSQIPEKKRKRYKVAWAFMMRGFTVALDRDLVCNYPIPGSFELFRQTQRGRPIGGEPEPVEELRPVTGARTQSQLSTRDDSSKSGSKKNSRSPTPRGKTPTGKAN